MMNETSKRSSPEFYIANILGLRQFTTFESQKMIEDFSRIAKMRLQSPSQESPGPMMLPSHISPPETPLAEIVGKKAIGIDIGGTNLRISVGEIDKTGLIKPVSKIKSKEIPIKYNSLEDFFRMLLKNGLDKLLRNNPDLPLACIFSFPGTGIESSIGIDMTIANDDMPKGWHITDAKGKNFGEELNKFLNEQRKYFIANDTVALIQNKNIDFGIVCGTGYNWSMVVGNTIINTESGQAAVAPKINYISDDQTPLKDEYQVSGKYLEKTLGLIVDKLRNEYKGHGLFSSVKNTVFPKSFVVSNILNAEKTGNWKMVKKDFQTHKDFSEHEKGLLIQIASALRDRSAQIVANHLFALWKTGCPEKKHLNIASDGPIIWHMPGWKEKFIQEINFVSERKLEIEIKETLYQGRMRDFRGIFDVMSQAIKYI